MILENNNNNFNCSKPINGCFFFGPNIWYTSNIKERKNITLYNCWIISFYNATNRIKHRFICNRQNNNKYQHFSGHNLIIIAIEMIISSFKEKEEKFLLSIPGYLLFGLSVSIDSLTTGIGFSAITDKIVIPL